MSRIFLAFAILALALFTACTTPRPLLPTDGSFKPPAEANFDERPEVVQLDKPGTYSRQGFTPPEFVQALPGSNAVSPRNNPGVFDAYVYFVVETDGRVRQVKLIVKSGTPEFDEVIQRDVQRWVFKPATMNGKPVAASFGQIFRVGVTTRQ